MGFGLARFAGTEEGLFCCELGFEAFGFRFEGWWWWVEDGLLWFAVCAGGLDPGAGLLLVRLLLAAWAFRGAGFCLLLLLVLAGLVWLEAGLLLPRLRWWLLAGLVWLEAGLLLPRLLPAEAWLEAGLLLPRVFVLAGVWLEAGFLLLARLLLAGFGSLVGGLFRLPPRLLPAEVWLVAGAERLDDAVRLEDLGGLTGSGVAG